MGNQESRGQDFIDQFPRNYRFERDVNDARLGEVKIYNRIFDEKDSVAVKVYPRLQKINQLSTFSAFMNQNGSLIGTNLNEHPNLIKLYAFKVSADEELTLYYEYCYTNVKEQIDMRVGHGYYFSAEELWRTTLSVIMAGYFLETQNRHIGDINTKRMLINKKGIVKVPPYMQAQTDIDSFKRAGFFNEYGYLSPECLEKFKQRDILSQVNFIKNDIYGLGMSIVEMATLKSSAQMYDWDKYEIKQSIFDERLEETRQRYGEYLLQFLRKMLTRDPILRYSFSELFQEILPYQQQIITGVGFQDIQIFKPSNNVSNFDSIIRKLDGINSHSKQESMASTQYQGGVTTKISNLPSIYSSSDQSRTITLQQQQQLLYNFGQPASVQINLSPTKLTSQPIILQQKQPLERDSYRFKTEESDTSIINKGFTSQEVANIYTQNNNNKLYTGSSVNNVSQIIGNGLPTTIQTVQMGNSDGFNTTRENTLKYKISNVHRPLNPDQRSLSPSPVLHMQVLNQYRVAPQIQHTPISMKTDREFHKKTPLYSDHGNITDRVALNQIPAANQINLNDYKKAPVPVKKITLNNLLNQNVSVKTITTQPNKVIVNSSLPQPVISNISQENIYNGNIVTNQPLDSKRGKEPMQVQINIPVHRTNRNMIISPYPHNQRSVSPSHFMVQRSITPNVRPSMTNQIMFVSPSSTVHNKTANPINHTINTNNIHYNMANLHNISTNNDAKQKHPQFSFQNNNLSLPEAISPRFSIQTNPVNNHSNGNLQGFNTERHAPTSSLTEQKLQSFVIPNHSQSGFQQKNKQSNLDYAGLSPKAQ